MDEVAHWHGMFFDLETMAMAQEALRIGDEQILEEIIDFADMIHAPYRATTCHPVINSIKAFTGSLWMRFRTGVPDSLQSL